MEYRLEVVVLPVSFGDLAPGNGWLVHGVTTRLPGR